MVAMGLHAIHSIRRIKTKRQICTNPDDIMCALALQTDYAMEKIKMIHLDMKERGGGTLI